MIIEAQDTASTSADTVKQNLRALGWLSPEEAELLIHRMNKVERIMREMRIEVELVTALTRGEEK